MCQANLQRADNESAFEYHRRLIHGKLVDKTLADCDYSELAELVYGQSYSSDVARRMMYGSKRTLELFDRSQVQSITDNAVIRDIEEKTAALKREQQKFWDQRREYNKLVYSDGRREHIYEVLADAANNLSESIGAMFSDNYFDLAYSNGNEAVLVFSDWHYGMKTNNVFNEYNADICKARVTKVVDMAIERLRIHRCSKLHIVVLGDLIHGACHVSARVASNELVADQLMQVSELLAQAIMRLSQFTSETLVYVTYGNHARTVQNKKESMHQDNMERIVPWWLEQRLQAYNNITIMPDNDTEFLFINACGHEICATHGDLDGVKNSPRLLTTIFQKKYNKDIEYILLGDKHHRESFSEFGVTAAICGALCGTDDYANDKRLYSHPEQMMLIVNPQYGVDAEYRLRCDIS